MTVPATLQRCRLVTAPIVAHNLWTFDLDETQDEAAADERRTIIEYLLGPKTFNESGLMNTSTSAARRRSYAIKGPSRLRTMPSPPSGSGKRAAAD
jgi:hypothetical protein